MNSASTASGCAGCAHMASATDQRPDWSGGRSYHRPRGIVASGCGRANALVNMGQGGRFEPNQHGTTTELFDGLKRQPEPLSQPGIRRGRAEQLRLALPARRLHYKTFITRGVLKHVFEPVIRQSAASGKSAEGAGCRPPRTNLRCDLRSSRRHRGLSGAGRGAAGRGDRWNNRHVGGRARWMATSSTAGGTGSAPP